MASSQTRPIPYPFTYQPGLNAGVPTAFLEDGAITLIGGGCAVLTSPDAGAYTLAAPAPNSDGALLFIVSLTAAAHVITATNLINGNDDTITFGAAIGNAVTLMSYNSEWLTVAEHNITVG